jgi:hypothetical protein
MPISACDGCAETHWVDVKRIMFAAIEAAGFSAALVSDADDIGVIQKRIVENLYVNEMIVCDISGRNANVMFELGMRLAFDKPTIIVKDDKTPYSFDTGVIEHLEYPRDLRYQKIVDFSEKLAEKLTATFKKASEDREYSPFLKNFGTFLVASLDTREVSKDTLIMAQLAELKQGLQQLQQRSPFTEIAARRMLEEIAEGIRAESAERLTRAWTYKPSGLTSQAAALYGLTGGTGLDIPMGGPLT